MDKLWLIIKREYLTRVRKRSFILTTLLAPLGMLVFILMAGWIFSYKSDTKQHIVILDQQNLMNQEIEEARRFIFTFSDLSLEELKKEVEGKTYDGILHLPKLDSVGVAKYKAFFYTDDQLDVESSMLLERRIKKKIRNYKMVALGLDESKLKRLETSVEVDPEPLTEGQEDRSAMTGVVASVLGGVMGYFMFFIIILYGTMVMKSVSEEKVNRIVEVVISSVKPFQLMMGKIIGVGGVGFTQFAIWMILLPIIGFIGNMIFGASPEEMMGVGNQIPAEMISESSQKFTEIMSELKSLNWWLIVPMFIIYFLGGYFIYASLFAAIGSAMGDDINEAQSLTMPIMLPIIFAIYIMFQVIREPHSTLAVWSSMVPFFSPIIMPARLAYDPPLWQVFLSVVILLISVIGLVWLAGRIYRVGILLYGKKATFKELWKWIWYKG